MNIVSNYLFLNLVLYSLLLLLINWFLKRKKFLIYKTYNQKHKIENKKGKIVLSGGIFFILVLTICNFQNSFAQLNFLIYSIFFVIIGVFSDLNKGITAKTRLIIMNVVSFLILINSQLIIDKIDIKILDFFLKFNLVSLLIFTIAIVTIINGANFIDGSNANCSGYFLLVYFLLIHKAEYFEFSEIDLKLIENIFIGLIIFSFLNLFNKNYLGDNGAYVLGFITSILSIHLFSKYSIPSLFIVAFFTYPVAEIAISIIRKFLESQNPMSPDRKHLHQLIEDKVFLKKNKLLKNNLSSIVIMSLNLIYFVLLLKSDLAKVELIQLISGYFFAYISFYLFVRIILKSKKKS